MITPNNSAVTKVLVNFLTDKEIDATRGEAVEQKDRLLEKIHQVRRELQESVEAQRLNAELHAAKKRYQRTQRALKKYQPPEDPERQRLLQELREAQERMVVAEEVYCDFPLHKILQDTRRELKRLEDIFTAHPDNITLNLLKERDEIHGITRARIAAILNAIASGQSVPEEMFTEEPSLYKEIKDYLAHYGIQDRISYEVKIFGYDEGTHWYRHCGVRGIFPKNLALLLLRRNRQHLTATDLLEAGDMLYGQLDKSAVVAELRMLLSSHGIHNGNELRAADYRRTILPILDASRYRSINMVYKILGRGGEHMHRLKFEERKMFLAQWIYGESGYN